MDVQQVKELAQVMAEHGLTEIRVREGESYICLRKGPLGQAVAWPPHVVAAPTAAALPAGAVPSESAAAPQSQENLVPIVSPMVGTYYAAPDPESGPFVTVGSEVDTNTPVCIIEAMKVFNEIRAEVAGTIERILVHNEQPVEYGQTLMLVRPRG